MKVRSEENTQASYNPWPLHRSLKFCYGQTVGRFFCGDIECMVERARRTTNSWEKSIDKDGYWATS